MPRIYKKNKNKREPFKLATPYDMREYEKKVWNLQIKIAEVLKDLETTKLQTTDNDSTINQKLIERLKILDKTKRFIYILINSKAAQILAVKKSNY